MTTKYSLTGRHFSTLMFEKKLKAYAELAEKLREKGWKKRILIFVQCFSF